VAENQPKKNRMPEPFVEIYLKIRAFMHEEGGDFGSLALELFRAQRKLNPAYERLCAVRGIREVTDWREIPAVPAVAFKELEMTSLSQTDRARVFFSSGTTQRDRSRHFHSETSLQVYEESLWRWFGANFREQIAGRKWLFLTPRGSAAPNSSLAHMFETIASKLPPEEVEFVGETDVGGEWTLNIARTVEILREFARENQPTALLGTAFQFVHLVDRIDREGERIELPPKSWIMETGGYKGRSREVPKDQLREALCEQLGLTKKQIYGEYGMSELSSQAYDRADGVFRFPRWARVRIISPATGKDVLAGERGLIRVYDLANIWSVMAVQTEDFGMRMGDGFQLAGRAAQAEARGCSLMSA
jgi:hypothetical protein